ncbi:MAG: allantoate amidohydrolase [Acidobacteriaceae bacterium]
MTQLNKLPLLAQQCIDTCQKLAAFTEEEGRITRTFLSAPMRDAHHLLQAWMERLGMTVTVDAVGNLRGVYAAGKADAPRLLIGSHIDTVPSAGPYDGVLGVVMALALMEALEGKQLDYAVEVIAFSEEEGVRFGVPFIGSRALIGEVDEGLLDKADSNGITLRQAIQNFGLDPAKIPDARFQGDVMGYLEFHIEQGPVLESMDRGLGIVETIVGQSRLEFVFRGKANHAGTTPMKLRQDALTGAAEWIYMVEREANATDGLVATVGQISVKPNAGNVVPAEAIVSLDVRHADDIERLMAVELLIHRAQEIAARRGLRVEHSTRLEHSAARMDAKLVTRLEAAAHAVGQNPLCMMSGAGHDAMVIAQRIPTAMLFLRSPGGLSHHPDETVMVEDVEAALALGLKFLEELHEK